MKISKIAFVVVVFVAVASMAAHAQTQVFVPGNASGYFGNPVDALIPLVPAITVGGAGTITVTYLSGTVGIGNNTEVGPDGTPCKCPDYQLPLEEARGLGRKYAKHDGALMGVFVLQSRVQDRRGFNAIDGTKDATRVGIKPDGLFFIGEGKTFEVKQAGTLYLGINDGCVDDNSGGFNVEVTVQ